MRVGVAPGQVRVGPLLVKWRWPAPERGPLVEPGWGYALRPDLSLERFRGFVLRIPGRYGLAVMCARRVPAPVTTMPRAWDARARQHSP